MEQAQDWDPFHKISNYILPNYTFSTPVAPKSNESCFKQLKSESLPHESHAVPSLSIFGHWKNAHLGELTFSFNTEAQGRLVWACGRSDAPM